MAAVWKNVYIDKLDDAVDESNKTHRRTIKLKPDNVKSGACTECNVGFNAKKARYK